MKLILIIFLVAQCVLAQEQGTTFRGDYRHAGVFVASATAPFAQVKWKYKTDGKIFSSPIVTHGVVYVGSNDRNLYALKAEDGSVLWKFRTKGRVASSPALSEKTVFFGSYDGNLYAVDAETGKEKWKFQTAGERRYAGSHLHGSQPAAEVMPDPFDVFLSSPVVANGTVYFGSGDGNVYALKASSGELRWKFKTGDVVHASPAFADGVLYIGSWDSYFYALDADTGTQKWRFKTGEDPNIHNQVGIQSSAALADGMVYFGCRDSNFYALDAKTGEKRWSFSNHGSWVISSPAVRDGKVYFGTSDSGMFHVLEAKTGAPVFSLKFLWPMFSSPAIAGNTLYIGSHAGKLIAIDLQQQTTAWIYETDAAKHFGPTYTKPDGGPKYEAAFSDDFYDSMVIGFDRMLAVGAVFSSPAVDNGTIYFASADGYVYALQ